MYMYSNKIICKFIFYLNFMQKPGRSPEKVLVPYRVEMMIVLIENVQIYIEYKRQYKVS